MSTLPFSRNYPRRKARKAWLFLGMEGSVDEREVRVDRIALDEEEEKKGEDE